MVSLHASATARDFFIYRQAIDSGRKMCPPFRIVRNYVDESGEILLSTVSYHPGDRYAFNLNARVPEHKRNERLDETLFDRLRNGS